MKYLSCFSGIGGLEASVSPEVFCEIDAEVSSILKSQHPGVEVWPDVQTFEPPQVEVVAGGWPCQDISIAGNQAGLSGLRSGLLLDMLRVAQSAGAHTVVAENVANLLKMRNGSEFDASLRAMHTAGFPFVSWRLLNAREFGLPQHRSRLLIIASQDRALAQSLFRTIPKVDERNFDPEMKGKAAGFYWTAGTHSINYSRGYVPTIKVGSGLGIASPPAVHYDDVVRLLSPREALLLQGFDIPVSAFSSPTAAYRASGNAVARPIGRWVLDGVLSGLRLDEVDFASSQDSLFSDTFGPGRFPDVGISIGGRVLPVVVGAAPLVLNLVDFLDTTSEERLSPRASQGLLDRLERSGQDCPARLYKLLTKRAAEGEKIA